MSVLFFYFEKPRLKTGAKNYLKPINTDKSFRTFCSCFFRVLSSPVFSHIILATNKGAGTSHKYMPVPFSLSSVVIKTLFFLSRVIIITLYSVVIKTLLYHFPLHKCFVIAKHSFRKSQIMLPDNAFSIVSQILACNNHCRPVKCKPLLVSSAIIHRTFIYPTSIL